MKKMTVKLTFIEDILGTLPFDKDIYVRFILGRLEEKGVKLPDELRNEEINDLPVDEQLMQGMTIFPRTEDGNPFLYDYQVKGFFKGACSALKKIPDTESSKIKAYKKEIDLLIFPSPRKIMFENAEIDVCQRPLRAQTMQGERVTLAMSEAILAGATVTFDIGYFTDAHEKLIREWLDYGVLNGIGQWRNSGKGRFTWEEIK